MSTARLNIMTETLISDRLWSEGSSFKDMTYAQAVSLLNDIIEPFVLMNPIPEKDEILTHVSNATRVDFASLMLYAQEVTAANNAVYDNDITKLYPVLEKLLSASSSPFLPMCTVYQMVGDFFLDAISISAAQYLDIEIDNDSGTAIRDKSLAADLRKFTVKCIQEQKFLDSSIEHTGDPLVAWATNTALKAALGSTSSRWISTAAFPADLTSVCHHIGKGTNSLDTAACIKSVIQFGLLLTA